MPQIKLSETQREEIRELYATGEYPYSYLAHKYDVSINTISRCVNDPTGEKTRRENRDYYHENAQMINRKVAAANKEFRLKLNKNIDGDVIEFLESKHNIRQYLLGLIKADMKKHS